MIHLAGALFEVAQAVLFQDELTRRFAVAGDEDVEGEAIDPLAVLLDERLERRHIAGAAALDQGEIVEFRHRSPARPAAVAC